MDKTTRRLTSNAIVVALYFVLTTITSPFAYGDVQIRIAEVLVLLCFFRRDFVIGVTLGCLVTNIYSPMGIVDVVFGSLATLISCLLISFSKHLFIASLFPAVLNGLIVGAELYYVLELPFWASAGFVALGEFIAVSIIGYILFMVFRKQKWFFKVIDAKRNLEFKW